MYYFNVNNKKIKGKRILLWAHLPRAEKDVVNNIAT